ncbi:MAG: hypothetical protein AAGE84_02820 [Cyanobacteria bacterium P01_G01_bin.39]
MPLTCLIILASYTNSSVVIVRIGSYLAKREDAINQWVNQTETVSQPIHWEKSISSVVKFETFFITIIVSIAFLMVSYFSLSFSSENLIASQIEMSLCKPFIFDCSNSFDLGKGLELISTIIFIVSFLIFTIEIWQILQITCFPINSLFDFIFVLLVFLGYFTLISILFFPWLLLSFFIAIFFIP